MELNSSMSAGMAATRGKSMQSIGYLAKMAVAQARENGGEVQRNAQGAAASAFARGADMETVLASLVSAETPEPQEPEADGMPVVDAAPVATPDAVEDAPTAGAAALAVPEVDVQPLDRAATPILPERDPVPAVTTAPIKAVASSMADGVARDALEMLFGQATDDQPG